MWDGTGGGGGSGSLFAARPGSLITLVSYPRLANRMSHQAGKSSHLIERLYTSHSTVFVAHLTSPLYHLSVDL